MANWSELLPGILIDIASRVTSLPDQTSFAGVCQSWRSAAESIPNFVLSPPRFPFLLLADKHEEGEEEANIDEELRQLLILPSNICNLRLPEASKRHCLSSRGWLLTIGEDNNDVNLLNPLTRQQINLPKLDTFAGHENGDQHFLSKVVLSCNPLSEEEDCFVMVIWGDTGRLGFCKLGDASWTDVAGWMGCIKDITYHNRLLYGVYTKYGDGIGNAKLIVCDVHHSNPKVSVVVDLPMYFHHSTMYVLAGFDDNKLLVVVRVGVLEKQRDHSTGYSIYETKGFEVFEFNLDDNKWSKIDNLGDRTIFVGYNSSLWIVADSSAVKPNCVYFSDDVYENYLRCTGGIGGGKDMGVFHLSDRIIEPHFNGESCSMVSPPLWVVPEHH